MNPTSVVESLREAGVLLGLRGGELRYLAEPGRMSPELRRRIEVDREQILRELSGQGNGARQPEHAAWSELVARELRDAAERAGIELDDERLGDRVEAAEERAAILEFEAGLHRSEAEARALEASVAAIVAERNEPVRFVEVCDLTPALRIDGPPIQGCFCCGNREFVRVRGGPMWICVRCHPPQFEQDIVEWMTTPEPSQWEARNGQ